ncbi:hypothetical protein QEN19_000483 [Hanseniaspora menglaensis]
MFSSLVKTNLKNIAKNGHNFRTINAYRPLSFKFLNKFKLPEQNPGCVDGTINDKLKTQDVSYFEGGFHWSYEKIISVALIPSTLIPLYSYFALENLNINPIMDAALSTLILVHATYGFKSCIIDYIPKRKFGYWHILCKRLLQLGGVLSLYGIFIMETENSGLTNLIKKLWRAKSSDEED